MGRIYTLSGPSGVGKTVFLGELSGDPRAKDIRLIPRYTDRPPRDDEMEGFEYYFTSHAGILQKVSANDFVHIEKWGDFYSGIESRAVEEVIKSGDDGIVLASTFGSARLRATYGSHVISVYMWTGIRPSLLNPRCMEHGSPEITELKWRLGKRLAEDGFSEYEVASLSDNKFIDKRMVDNFLDIAAVNGRLRSGEDIVVLPNLRGAMADTVSSFLKARSRLGSLSGSSAQVGGKGCFVLMPFREELRPVYDDHIVKVCESLGLSVTRADRIFSANPVMDDIVEGVLTARYIIADLTDNNPNVLYELGICHALGKKVILVTQSPQAPFDLAHLRRIEYAFTPPGMRAFETKLRSALATLQVTG